MTWNWSQVSRTISEYATLQTNELGFKLWYKLIPNNAGFTVLEKKFWKPYLPLKNPLIYWMILVYIYIYIYTYICVCVCVCVCVLIFWMVHSSDLFKDLIRMISLAL